MEELALGWSDAGLVVLTATSVYVAMLVLSRLFGQRQFATITTYDIPFVFAIGSLVGRVILVRTSLAAALVGLVTLFLLHSVTGWLHHHVPAFHRLSQNRPVLLAVDGRILEEGLDAAHTSRLEVYEAVRLRGLASLEETRAVVLERNGRLSVIPRGASPDPELWREVAGVEHLLEPEATP